MDLWHMLTCIFQNCLTQWLCCLVDELHTVVMHAVIHWLHRFVLFLLTLFEGLNARILLKMSERGYIRSCWESTLCLVTSFWVAFAEHLNSLILSMTMVWLIQQAHWALASSVKLWHLGKEKRVMATHQIVSSSTSYCWQLRLSSYPDKEWCFLHDHPELGNMLIF